jgi:CspA family cold shock protein
LTLKPSDICNVDIFVHFSSIESTGYKTLSEGDRVEFDIEESDRGPEAKNVKKQ